MSKHEATIDSDARLQARREFAAGCRRSKRGNLWRKWQGLTVCVYKYQATGRYGWSIASPDNTRFSAQTFDSEESALSALVTALGIELVS
jgi:hypothetical protein